MRIALIGDFDTYFIRGLTRPRDLLPYRGIPGLNLLRGLREIGGGDRHIVVCTPEVKRPQVEDGPYGRVHRLPQPPLSGTGSFHLWRRHIILRELQRIRPDIVHGQGSEREYAFTAVSAPVPHVITFHGIMHRVHAVAPPPLVSVQNVARWLERVVVRRARHVIAISPEVEDFLRARGSQARCWPIPNAMAPCFFDVPRHEPAPGQLRLLFVGRFAPAKGLAVLVEALALLRPRLGATVTLRVIGWGEDKPYEIQVRRRAEACGVAGQIEWLGRQDEEGVASALAESEVLVLPSFVENMPMCVGEAFAAGVAVVGTRADGVRRCVEHGQTGLLVTPGNAVELAEAIEQLYQDAPLRRQLAGTGRARARALYPPRVVAEQTLAVYRWICENTQPAGS